MSTRVRKKHLINSQVSVYRSRVICRCVSDDRSTLLEICCVTKLTAAYIQVLLCSRHSCAEFYPCRSELHALLNNLLVNSHTHVLSYEVNAINFPVVISNGCCTGVQVSVTRLRFVYRLC